ncbi:ATP-binding protein [Kitasatospora sp. NPDC056783]|uniref:ATP-binding protein n=1 Tax=Kitasatospora sp. NPDC056783 TaxID=3345943 RepID=UPI0036884F67
MSAPSSPTAARPTPPEPGWFLVTEALGFRIHLEVVPAALARVRAAAREHLAPHVPPATIETVELFVTELLTNVHNALGPHAPAVVRVIRGDGFVHLSVADPAPNSGPTAAHKQPAEDIASLSESGRGLLLIDRLGSHRRIRFTATGKQIHCHVAVDS